MDVEESKHEEIENLTKIFKNSKASGQNTIMIELLKNSVVILTSKVREVVTVI